MISACVESKVPNSSNPSSFKTDVVIIGAGPTGLMAAQALASFGLGVMVVERRDAGEIYGNADGLQPRTLEIWNSYGFLDKFSKQAATVHGLLTVKHLVDKLGRKPPSSTSQIQAKYIIGADGAHSWVRQQIGVKLEGERAGKSLYIFQIFLQIQWNYKRMFGAWCYHLFFNLLRWKEIIPREEDKLRIYVQCSSEDQITCQANSDTMTAAKYTEKKLLQHISNGLQPYKIIFTKIFWSTVFSASQKVADTFRVGSAFIAGDSAHTHSPKAGQGANVSMGDAHNLAWKLAWVVKGWSDDSLLDTYETERRALAHQLIKFDKAISATLDGCKASVYSSMLHQQNLFSSGIGIRYKSRLVIELESQKGTLDISGLAVGTRLPPTEIIRMADWQPMDMQDLAPCDVLFKVLIFAGDLFDHRHYTALQGLTQTFQKMADSKDKEDASLLQRFTMYTIIINSKESNIWKQVPTILRDWKRYIS
ncbi:FAD binding domain-containing protein [Lentinula edodes]|uniref:FAD binding domain-containing protein n=1 Tax=Lentinula edodes TaxID=5353 RepID=UPI001E8E9454|nr:FAD binding domain-containing protein [Lentinula edodes]KAH7874205.1 FAD binding domain-containing protein [Lentinula edodes]